MRKVILYLLVMVQIFALVGCSSKVGMKHDRNAIISEQFQKMIHNYSYRDKDNILISLYGFDSEISPIATLSLQNLLNKHDVDVSTLDEKTNLFYFSYIKSLYDNKNYMHLDMLTKDSCQYDYFLMLNIAKKFNDIEFLNNIKQKYVTFFPISNTISERIYRQINTSILEIDNQDSVNVNEKLNDFIVRFQYNSVDDFKDLDACLNYVQYFGLEIEQEKIQKIYNNLFKENNEKFMMFQKDIVISQYMNCLSILLRLLNKDVKETFFYEYEKYTTFIYQPIQYEILSLRNFALYLTSLYYANEHVDDTFYHQLLIIANELKNKVTSDDYSSVFYYKYISNLLNINFDMDLENKGDKNFVSQYYVKKLHNEDSVNDIISFDEIEDMTMKLMYLDMNDNQNLVKEKIKDIHIFDKTHEKDFPFLLNIYVCILINNDLLDDTTKTRIENYIKSKENILGYSGTQTNYDFEASCYYTNILNMLNKGYDIGLR